MPKRFLTLQEQQDICTRYQNGEALYPIGREYRTQTPTLVKMLTEHGISIRPSRFIKDGKGSYGLFTDEQLIKIVELYNQLGSINKVAKEFNVAPDTIQKWLIKKGVQLPTKIREYKCNRDFFTNIDTQEKAYVLGLIISDGCISPDNYNWYIALKETDVDLLEQVKLVLDSDHPIKTITRDGLHKIKSSEKLYTLSNLAKLSIGSAKMIQDLYRLGIKHNKSLSVPWPSIPLDLNRHMLRGIFDGDGSISIGSYSTKESPVFKIISGSEELLYRCQMYLINQIHLNKTKLDRSTGYPAMVYQGRENCRKLYNLMYDNATIFLKRKKARFDYLYNPYCNLTLEDANKIYSCK